MDVCGISSLNLNIGLVVVIAVEEKTADSTPDIRSLCYCAHASIHDIVGSGGDLSTATGTILRAIWLASRYGKSETTVFAIYTNEGWFPIYTIRASVAVCCFESGGKCLPIVDRDVRTETSYFRNLVQATVERCRRRSVSLFKWRGIAKNSETSSADKP